MTEGARFLIVKRRPIDVYISFAKAVSTQGWILKDTTDFRPELDIDDFLEWHHDRSHFYAEMEAMVARRNCAVAHISYERDILPSDMATLKHLVAILRGLNLDARIRADVYWKPPIKRVLAVLAKAVKKEPHWRPELGYVRQDRNLTVDQKVSNWADFRADLDARGGADKLEAYGA